MSNRVARLAAVIGLVLAGILASLITIGLVVANAFTGAPQPDGVRSTYVTEGGRAELAASAPYEYGIVTDAVPAHDSTAPTCTVTGPDGAAISISPLDRPAAMGGFLRLGTFVSEEAGFYEVSCEDAAEGEFLFADDVWATERERAAERQRNLMLTLGAGIVIGIGFFVAAARIATKQPGTASR